MVYREKMAFQAHKVPWVCMVLQVAQEKGQGLVQVALLDLLDLEAILVNEEKLVQLARVDFLDLLVMMDKLVQKVQMVDLVQKVKMDLLVLQGQTDLLVHRAMLGKRVQRVHRDYKAILVVLVGLVFLDPMVLLV